MYYLGQGAGSLAASILCESPPAGFAGSGAHSLPLSDVIFKHLDCTKHSNKSFALELIRRWAKDSEVVSGIDTADLNASQDISKAPLLKVIGYPSWNTLKDPASDRYSRTIVTRDGTTAIMGSLGKESA